MDHSSLFHVMNNKVLNNRIHQGSPLLQEYNLHIVIADALTRDDEAGVK